VARTRSFVWSVKKDGKRCRGAARVSGGNAETVATLVLGPIEGAVGGAIETFEQFVESDEWRSVRKADTHSDPD
jgi:hypothetical protein